MVRQAVKLAVGLLGLLALPAVLHATRRAQQIALCAQAQYPGCRGPWNSGLEHCANCVSTSPPSCVVARPCSGAVFRPDARLPAGNVSAHACQIDLGTCSGAEQVISAWAVVVKYALALAVSIACCLLLLLYASSVLWESGPRWALRGGRAAVLRKLLAAVLLVTLALYSLIVLADVLGRCFAQPAPPSCACVRPDGWLQPLTTEQVVACNGRCVVWSPCAPAARLPQHCIAAAAQRGHNLLQCTAARSLVTALRAVSLPLLVIAASVLHFVIPLRRVLSAFFAGESRTRPRIAFALVYIALQGGLVAVAVLSAYWRDGWRTGVAFALSGASHDLYVLHSDSQRTTLQLVASRTAQSKLAAAALPAAWLAVQAAAAALWTGALPLPPSAVGWQSVAAAAQAFIISAPSAALLTLPAAQRWPPLLRRAALLLFALALGVTVLFLPWLALQPLAVQTYLLPPLTPARLSLAVTLLAWLVAVQRSIERQCAPGGAHAALLQRLLPARQAGEQGDVRAAGGGGGDDKRRSASSSVIAFDGALSPPLPSAVVDDGDYEESPARLY